MKRSNVILHAAVASALLNMAGGAQAGVMSATAVKFATELFGSSASATNVLIKPSAAVYTFNTPGGIVINPSGVIYAYLRLSGGTFAAATVADFAFGAGISGLAATATSIVTDSSTVRVTITNTSTVNQTIGVGGTMTWTPAANSVGAVNTTLAAAAGAVTIQGSMASSSSSPSASTALPADLDNGASTAVTLATSGSAITAAIAASSTFAVAETQKVDLLATTPGSRFTAPGTTSSNANSTTVVNLGSLTFTNVATTMAVDGTTAYTIAGRGTAATLAGTVTGTFKASSTMALTTDLACTAGIVAGSSGTLNTALTTFTFSGGTLPTSGTANYVCLTVPATTAQIPLGTPTASFTFTKTTTTDAATTAAGSLYTLAYNGSQVDVRNYVPAANTGWSTILRIINTGTVTANVSGAFINETTGVVGTSGTLVSNLVSGGAATITSSAIEGVLGAQAVGARPRVRLTAPTNGMDVQTYVFTPSGQFSIIHGKE
ncbi:MAG: hypothetical protein EPO19_08590 [Betaproteobacteria bacterium]|nr:MAG: hypothetical protein EPO19_08590 [Betaproteobacteria bacterium]